MLESNNMLKKNLHNEINPFYQELINQDKEILKNAEEEIKKICHEVLLTELITNENHRTSLKVTINKRLTKRENLLLIKRLCSNKYHVEIKQNEENTIINVYPLNL